MNISNISKFQYSPLGDGGKVVLGFSGGLDTSYCVKHLTDEKGYEVHSIIVNTGGFTNDELKQIEAHAYKLGVKSHTTVDAVL
jgi:argininosuccinate synthase